MRSMMVALVLSAATALPVLAALPPHYERQKELSAVLSDSRVVEVLGIQHPIDSVIYVQKDLVRVSGGRCHVDVRIVAAPTAHPPGWVGPREFAVEAGALVCE